jgi:hypothetical protein
MVKKSSAEGPEPIAELAAMSLKSSDRKFIFAADAALLR